jgi:hypothetical protein
VVHNWASAVVGVALAEVMTMGIKTEVEPLELWERCAAGATGDQRTFDHQIRSGYRWVVVAGFRGGFEKCCPLRVTESSGPSPSSRSTSIDRAAALLDNG